ncbi:MAG: F0F1 ATP synthase subunit A [Candidatus Pacebacteria bacterium]|nr:F0F1 ATP synthase subunit A [Candidatus Paceibacterota bacterium]
MTAVEAKNVIDTTTHANEAHDAGIHIMPLAAEQLGTFYGLPINNTLLTSWVVILILIIVAFFVGRSIKMVPGKIQIIFESMIAFVYNYMTETFEDRKLARIFLPLILTLFLFILFANSLQFTPGIGSVGIWHGETLVPLFRSVNTDLNVTLALALISFIVIEFTGIFKLGLFTYIGKFISFKSPLAFIIGIIELGSELVRVVSFSFRLFGNILAGEVLIAVVAYFVPYILPSALMSFELFIGFVQACIFALLTLLFIKLAVIKPH